MVNSNCAAPKRKIVGRGIEAWGWPAGYGGAFVARPRFGVAQRPTERCFGCFCFAVVDGEDGWRWEMMGLKAAKREERALEERTVTWIWLVPVRFVVCLICWPRSGWGTFWGRSRSSELGPESGDGNDVGVQVWRQTGGWGLGKGESRRGRGQCRQPRCNFFNSKTIVRSFFLKVFPPSP